MQTTRSMALGAIIAVAAALSQPAAAQDKVKVGVFPTASSLPYFVAIERGFFKEQNIGRSCRTSLYSILACPA